MTKNYTRLVIVFRTLLAVFGLAAVSVVFSDYYDRSEPVIERVCENDEYFIETICISAQNMDTDIDKSVDEVFIELLDQVDANTQISKESRAICYDIIKHYYYIYKD